MSLYLKWTKRGRVPLYQGGKPIPVDEWTATVKNPVLCKRGWHACRWDDALFRISNELWVCELDGPIVEGDREVVGSRLRLVEQVTAIDDRALRLFAADCAERVLPIFEREHPDDHRPREAIRVARLYAEGETTQGVLAAAWGAAMTAAEDAARAAVKAARAAAGAASGDASWAASWAAVEAAGAAAGAASWAAVEAAGAASWAASWAVARAWQTDRLLVHYGGLDPDQFARRVAA